MKEENKTQYEDTKVSTRVKLTGLWTTLMILYLYCDIFTFFKPGFIEEFSGDFMGPFQKNQISLLIAGLLMALPALMIAANLFVKMPAVKRLNIIAGIVYTLVNLGNIIGESWAYYLFYGIVELFITILIIITAIKWTKIQA